MKATFFSLSLAALAIATTFPHGQDDDEVAPAPVAPAQTAQTAEVVTPQLLSKGAAAWETQPQGRRIIPPLVDSAIIDGGKRKEILYGPYTIPAGGMITKNIANAESPCKNCYVTAMFATIKYPNGKEALTSEGAWLHHTVLAGWGGAMSGAIWAAGNERPTIRLNSAHKYGIDWPNSNLMLTLDLMSEKKEAFNVSMSITYEYIEKDSEIGKQYKPIYMRWNQIGFPPPPKGKKTYKSSNWTSTVNGQMLYTIGHMHDGGTNLKLLVNGKIVCDSVMFYSGQEGYEAATPTPAVTAVPAAVAAPMKMGGHSHGRLRRSPQEGGHGHDKSFGGQHISNPGACTNFGAIKKGDIMSIEADYDMTKYPTMVHNGKEERLMGNMRVYIGKD